MTAKSKRKKESKWVDEVGKCAMCDLTRKLGTCNVTEEKHCEECCENCCDPCWEPAGEWTKEGR